MPVTIHERRTPVWNSTTAVVSGTADVNVIHQPVWFEIRADGGSGPLIDYGAFPQKPDWRFQARHLHFGDNQVPVISMPMVILTLIDAVAVMTPASMFSMCNAHAGPLTSNLQDVRHC